MAFPSPLAQVSEASREAAYDRDAALIQADPELIWVFRRSTMFANDADTPGAEERQERMKRAIMLKSPGLIQDPGQQGPNPEMLQQQNQQLQQEVQKVHAFAQSLQEQLQTKQPEIDAKMKQAQLDAEIKKYTVDQQELTKRTIAEAQLNGQLAIKRLEQEIAAIEGKANRTQEIGFLKDAEHQHATEMAESGRTRNAMDQQTAGGRMLQRNSKRAQRSRREFAHTCI